MSSKQEDQAAVFSKLFNQLPDSKFAKPQLSGNIEPEIDLPAAFKATLDAPEFYPPLSDSVFPGDSVAIVLQSNIPHPRKVLDALLYRLASVNVAVSDILVVITRRTADQLQLDPVMFTSVEDNKPEGTRPVIFPVEFEFNTINFQVHDPENQTGHAYLAASAEADPIHVNRCVVDADVVLPVGCPRPGEANQQGDCIYPDFSNESTIQRFSQGKGSFISRWQEIELANDALGAFFSIQIVCGPGDSIRQVYSGARKDAVNSARAATNELWSLDWNAKTDVVVATIESNPGEQNWDDFSNALVASSSVAKSDGPIVIWSEIGLTPDRNTRKACMSQFDDVISAKLPKKLQHVAAIVSDRPVFLRSRLSRNVVEELGLGFVESAEEIVRIAEPHSTGLVIRDAHKCQIRTEVESNTGQDQSIEEME